MPERRSGTLWIVTAEHASRAVPRRERPLFAGAEAVLAGHRAWDPGARELARDLAELLSAPLFLGEVSRLVCDLNRSVGHRDLFSEFTRDLPAARREQLLARYWRPFRAAVEAATERATGRARRVVHLSAHSFTPVFDGVARSVDVGLLYDPRRPREAALGRRLARNLATRRPDLRVRRNNPYRGSADGHVTALRRRFGARYLGLELEISQAITLGPPRAWTRLREELVELVAAEAP